MTSKRHTNVTNLKNEKQSLNRRIFFISCFKWLKYSEYFIGAFYRCANIIMFRISLLSIRRENYRQLYRYRNFQFPSIYEVEEISAVECL